MALLLPLTSIPTLAAEPHRLELDVGVALSAVDTAYATAVAPAVTVRAAVDLGNFSTVGIRGLGVLGADPRNGGAGYQAWAVVPEVRFHPRTRKVQPFLELGVGVGQLLRASGGDREVTLTHGDPGLFLQGGLGMRVIGGPVTVTAEGLLMLFTQVMGGNDAATRPPTPEAEARKEGVLAVMFQLSIGLTKAL